MSLQETMFPMQKCPGIVKVVTNLHGREKCLGALLDKTRRPCDMHSAQNLWERLVLELSSKRRILEEVVNGIRNQRVAKCTCYSEMYHSIA